MNDKIQMAIKVNDGASLDNLNKHLEMGWKVIDSVAMPSSLCATGGSFYQLNQNPTCLVIIEGEVCE